MFELRVDSDSIGANGDAETQFSLGDSRFDGWLAAFSNAPAGFNQDSVLERPTHCHAVRPSDPDLVRRVREALADLRMRQETPPVYDELGLIRRLHESLLELAATSGGRICEPGEEIRDALQEVAAMDLRFSRPEGASATVPLFSSPSTETAAAIEKYLLRREGLTPRMPK